MADGAWDAAARLKSRRRHRAGLVAQLSSTAIASFAFAADLPLKAPPPLVQDSWAGPYIGGHFAAAWRTGTESTLASRNDVGRSGDLNSTQGNAAYSGQAEATIASDVGLKERGPQNVTSVNFGAATTTITNTISSDDPQLQFRAGVIDGQFDQ